MPVTFFLDQYYNRVLTMADGTGTNYYSYNPVSGELGAGRLASVTVPIYGTGHTAVVGYTNSAGAVGYDALGRVVGRSVVGSNDTNYVSTAYDPLGRATNVTNALGSFTYGYVQETSRLSSVTYPTGTGMSSSYGYYGNTSPSGTGNGDQRLQTITNTQGSTQLSQFGYTYNPVGTIATWTQQTNSTSAATTNSLSYDYADQLTNSVQSGGGTASNAYHYDPAGNRLTETTATGTTAGQFNNFNQLVGITNNATSVTVAGHTSSAVSAVTVDTVPATISNGTNFTANVVMPEGTNVVSVVANPSTSSAATQRYQVVASGAAPTALTYDLNGNVLTDENGNSYAWDALNRLTKITYHAGGNSTFAYDGLSRRVQIVDTTSGGTVTTKNYLWIGSQIAEERNSTNTLTKLFFPQGEQQSGTNYYYTRDHLGSVREMLNSSGSIVARYAYDPYGRTTLVSGSNIATRQYAGYYQHQASGLELTQYRAFDPNTGRWLSRDPIAEQGGINLYGYVGNNPIDNIDPLGLLTVHYWAPQTVNAHGHLSITLDDGTYISNWPTNEGNILATSDTRTPNYNEDNAEEGTNPTDLYIGTLDEKKIEDWWNKQQRKNGYSGLSNNCSSTTANALRQGGLPVKSPSFYYSPTTTWPLINDAVNNRKTGGAGGAW